MFWSLYHIASPKVQLLCPFTTMHCTCIVLHSDAVPSTITIAQLWSQEVIFNAVKIRCCAYRQQLCVNDVCRLYTQQPLALRRTCLYLICNAFHDISGREHFQAFCRRVYPVLIDHKVATVCVHTVSSSL